MERLRKAPTGVWIAFLLFTLISTSMSEKIETPSSDNTFKQALLINSMNNSLHVSGCADSDIPPFGKFLAFAKVARICGVELVDANGLTGCTLSIDISGESEQYVVRGDGLYCMKERINKNCPQKWKGDQCPTEFYNFSSNLT